jgi:hypothetical protein
LARPNPRRPPHRTAGAARYAWEPGTEVRHPSIELAVGDLLTLTRTWRVVSIEPEQPVVSDLPGAGSGQIAAVLELVAR